MEEVEKSRSIRDEQRERCMELQVLYGAVKALVEDVELGVVPATPALTSLCQSVRRAECSLLVPSDGRLLGLLGGEAMRAEASVGERKGRLKEGAPLIEGRLLEWGRRGDGVENKTNDSIEEEEEDFVVDWKDAMREGERGLRGAEKSIEGRKKDAEERGEWAKAYGEALEGKSRMGEWRCRKEGNGSKEQAKGLRGLKEAQERAMDVVREKKRALEERRRQFKEAGEDEMSKLASDYASVLKQIEETKWALKEVTN